MSKGTILLVDDNHTNLYLLLEHLERSDYKLLIAPTGERALEQLERNVPDLILLDVMMPGIDGFETCRRLKQNEATKDVPVIFMTALIETVDKLRGFQAGGVDYVTKPFQPEEVLARVETHLTIRRLQKRLEGKNMQLEQEVRRRSKAEEELRVLNQELQEANASKDKFFSIIAHDLRSPFNWLLGLTSLLVENIANYTPEELKTLLNRLKTSTEKVYELLTNLLTWSRMQQGQIEYHPEYLPLARLVDRNFQLFVSGAEQKQITLQNRVAEHIRMYADPKMLDTVLRNLLSNALKFTNADGVIEVNALQRDEQVVTLMVSDTGRGMSPEDIAKLFRIDVKYTTTGTAGEKGTGLGLILCKELIERQNGMLSVESEIGKGTTFTVTLPNS